MLNLTALLQNFFWNSKQKSTNLKKLQLYEVAYSCLNFAPNLKEISSYFSKLIPCCSCAHYENKTRKPRKTEVPGSSSFFRAFFPMNFNINKFSKINERSKTEKRINAPFLVFSVCFTINFVFFTILR